MFMKKISIFGCPALILVLALLIYSHVKQNRREATYRAAIEHFQHDLALGLSRSEIEKYFHSRGVEYSWQNGANAAAYTVMIGEETGGLVCKSWKVYIALEFDASAQSTNHRSSLDPDPADKLTQIHITRAGICL
jgi:hypothetical protein